MMIEVAPSSAVAKHNVKKLAMQAKMSFPKEKNAGHWETGSTIRHSVFRWAAVAG